MSHPAGEGQRATREPLRRLRPDGAVEYRCPECGRWLVTARSAMTTDGDYVQAHCRTCKRERRFAVSVAAATMD